MALRGARRALQVLRAAQSVRQHAAQAAHGPHANTPGPRRHGPCARAYSAGGGGSSGAPEEAPAAVQTLHLDPPLGRALTAAYWHFRTLLNGHLASATIRHIFDKSFEESQFTSGARDAFFFVHELLEGGDVTQMQPLCSPAVFQSLQETLKSYADSGLRIARLEVTELRSIRLLSAWFEEGKSLGISDPEEDKLAGPPETPITTQGMPVHGLPASVGTLYLTARVRIEATETCELEKLGASAGEVAQRIVNTRGHAWVFARALPRALPAAELETAWRLVGIE